MANEPLSKYALYGYISDDTETYQVKMMIALGTTGNAATAVVDGANDPLPNNYKMRYLLGANATSGIRGKLHWLNPAATTWTTLFGTSWTGNNGTVYKTTGGIGEKRHNTL
jgi:hypothetical protein